ncbi:hypothetical protein [Nonomuraea sp. NPDC050643]|uniref:hypothetical protein n=1 Tax=Nonomuraea sp. NPDC050643 TaxID=3155660 RepID=UPI0033D455A8
MSLLEESLDAGHGPAISAGRGHVSRVLADASVQVVPMLNRADQKLLVVAFSGFVMHNPLRLIIGAQAGGRL